jgi:hypothetical protein
MRTLPELNIEIGDIVEFTRDVSIDSREGDTSFVEKGARYRVENLVGFGWDLEFVSGHGPTWVRILNSDVPKYVARVK